MESQQRETCILDDAFRVLADADRRRLLLALLDRGGGSIALDEPGRHGITASRVELHHVHLPKLAEKGFVECDREEAPLGRGARYHELRAVDRGRLSSPTVAASGFSSSPG